MIWSQTTLPMTASRSRSGDAQAFSKSALRARMRAGRLALSPVQARAAADEAAARLLGVDELAAATVIAVYSALRDELATEALAAGLRARGVRVAYPRIQRGERMLRFHQVDDVAELTAGTFGILQPEADAKVVSTDELDALVVPGLAFDRGGHRLGWGQGYYDTTLATCGRALRVGFAYDCQLVDEIPHEAHDVPMDIIVTNTGVIRPQARPSRAEPER